MTTKPIPGCIVDTMLNLHLGLVFFFFFEDHSYSCGQRIFLKSNSCSSVSFKFRCTVYHKL